MPPASDRTYDRPLYRNKIVVTPQAECLAAKLAIRKACEVGSERAGTYLKAGQSVLIMETRTLDDGTVCARVSEKTSPRGLMGYEMGWVTLATKEGKENLKVLSAEEERDILWRAEFDRDCKIKDHDAAEKPSDSMASRIALRRRENRASRIGNFQWIPYGEVAQLIMPELISQGVITARKISTDTTPAYVARDERRRRRSKSPRPTDMVMVDPLEKYSFAIVAKEGPEAHEAWMNPPYMIEVSTAYYEASRLVEAHFDTVAERVGMVMYALDLTEVDVVKVAAKVDIDKNGTMDKAQFRKLMRTLDSERSGALSGSIYHVDETPVSMKWLSGQSTDLLGRGCRDKEIDLYFATLDTNKSGSLDAQEVGRFLISLKAGILRGHNGAALRKLMELRKVAEAFVKGAEAITVARGVPPPPKPSITAKLGMVLTSKKIKIQELVSAWDEDGTGKIDINEFTSAMLKLGIEGSKEELEALHKSFDADGNGTLTPKEIVAALQKVQKEAFDQKKREDEAGKAAASAGATAETCMRTAMRLAWAADKMYFPHKIKK